MGFFVCHFCGILNSHQWCRVPVGDTYWICDAYGLYCGPEPAPYQHPYFQ